MAQAGGVELDPVEEVGAMMVGWANRAREESEATAFLDGLVTSEIEVKRNDARTKAKPGVWRRKMKVG